VHACVGENRLACVCVRARVYFARAVISKLLSASVRKREELICMCMCHTAHEQTEKKTQQIAWRTVTDRRCRPPVCPSRISSTAAAMSAS
jgi:hypothetical protein